MIYIFVSDFHLGAGRFLEDGQLNPFEDFEEDDRFAEFVEFHSTGRYYLEELTLVLNGDILNLIQIEFDGTFTRILDENYTLKALEKIIQGHQKFFDAMRKFLSRPNKKCLYIIGNHDISMDFKLVQDRFCKEVRSEVSFALSSVLHGIYVEHGHRLEPINTVGDDELYVQGPDERPICNLPWGSQFCISFVTQAKRIMPYVDRIRPLPAYMKWLIVHDPFLFISMWRKFLPFFFKSMFYSYTKGYKGLINFLNIFRQATIYFPYVKQAKRILDRDEKINAVVLGHIHICEWQRYRNGKLYFNTGTWNSIPSMDIGRHPNLLKLTYVLIEIDPTTSKILRSHINEWRGNWRPYREEVSILGT